MSSTILPEQLTTFELLKIEMQQMNGTSRKKDDVIAEVSAWADGDAHEAFEYAVEHGYIVEAGKTTLDNTLWKATSKLNNYTAE